MMIDFKELYNIISSKLDGSISFKTSEGLECYIQKDSNSITIKMINDSYTKELVKEFKTFIQEMDDDSFVELVEDLKSNKIDLNRFNDLLEKKNYTKEEAEELEEMIGISVAHIYNIDFQKWLNFKNSYSF